MLSPIPRGDPVEALKPPGIVKTWSRHLLEATKEPDGVTPSASRIFAGWLIAFVLGLQFVTTGTLLWLLLHLDPAHTNAPAMATVYIGLLKIVMVLGIVFDLATALSFYGINVWKYISGLANPISAASGLAANAFAAGAKQVTELVKTQTLTIPPAATLQDQPTNDEPADRT